MSSLKAYNDDYRNDGMKVRKQENWSNHDDGDHYG
jgi:hypothetical protein